MSFVHVDQIIVLSLALSYIDDIEEISDWFWIVDTRAAADNDRGIFFSVFGENADLGKVKNLYNICISHFVLDGNTEKIEQGDWVLSL